MILSDMSNAPRGVPFAYILRFFILFNPRLQGYIKSCRATKKPFSTSKLQVLIQVTIRCICFTQALKYDRRRNRVGLFLAPSFSVTMFYYKTMAAVAKIF